MSPNRPSSGTGAPRRPGCKRSLGVVERLGDDMTRQQWERVKDIFTEALEVEQSLRDTFARDAAAGDEELFSEIRRMLSESDRDSGLLSQPVLARARPF